MASEYHHPLEAGGRTLNLVFKFGTMRVAERELGRPLTSALASGDVGFDELSAIFWAALQPSLKITREASDDLVDEIGVEAVTKAVLVGVSRVFGKDPGESAAPGEAKAAKKAK